MCSKVIDNNFPVFPFITYSFDLSIHKTIYICWKIYVAIYTNENIFNSKLLINNLDKWCIH